MKAILVISFFYFALAYASVAIIAALIYFFNVTKKVQDEMNGKGSEDFKKDTGKRWNEWVK